MKLDIDWTAFLVVAVVVLAGVVVLTALYSGGIRLLETAGRTSVVARSGAWLCFGLCAAVVLFGLWLIVPQFHGS